MRLSRLVIDGFRNLSGEMLFPSSMTLIVGENNSGKSNVIDALRLLTAANAGPHATRWVTEADFTHDGSGGNRVSYFEITGVFRDLNQLQTGRLLTCLAPSAGSGVAKLKLVATRSSTGRIAVEWFGGDSKQPGVEQWAREAVKHTYLHPLRDAGADLRPGRDNKLVQLMNALAPADSASRQGIEGMMRAANQSLSDTEVVKLAKDAIGTRLRKMAGSRFAQRTDLVFADPRFERVVATIRALAGDAGPLELSENGLGYNNLLYMATLLAALKAPDPDGSNHLVLVEEPEAHLHPQLQDLLHRFLSDEASEATQVVVTTHSPNFAASRGVTGTTVLSRTAKGKVVFRSPVTFELDLDGLAHLSRFLDATKASLLFAKAVLLVEGIAEQLLLPELARMAGVNLGAAGVAIVNVGGTSFAPFAQLFGPDKLPCRCCIITDADPVAVADGMADGDAMLSATAKAIKDLENATLKVCLASKTFEWDLAAAGNWDAMLAALATIKPRVAKKLESEPPVGDVAKADALLKAVTDIKGRFAQSLASVIAGGAILNVPEYLKTAIDWVGEI